MSHPSLPSDTESLFLTSTTSEEAELDVVRSGARNPRELWNFENKLPLYNQMQQIIIAKKNNFEQY